MHWVVVKFFGVVIAVMGPHDSGRACASAATAHRQMLVQYYADPNAFRPRGLVRLAAGRPVTGDVIATECVVSATKPLL